MSSSAEKARRRSTSPSARDTLLISAPLERIDEDATTVSVTSSPVAFEEDSLTNAGLMSGGLADKSSSSAGRGTKFFVAIITAASILALIALAHWQFPRLQSLSARFHQARDGVRSTLALHGTPSADVQRKQPEPKGSSYPCLDRTKLKPLIVVPPQPTNVATFKYELTIGSFVAQGDPALIEWIEYHRMLGVEHFFLYEHERDPAKSSRPLLQSYIDAGIVELDAVTVPTNTSYYNAQFRCWKLLHQRGKGVTRWLALIDSDEFIVPKEHDSILSLLTEYQSHAGLTVNWQMFGTSRVSHLDPSDLLIERLQYRAVATWEENAHVKSIVQPDRTSKCRTVHHCDPESPYQVVDSTHANSPYYHRKPPIHDVVQNNHYFTRDERHLRRVKLAVRAEPPEAMKKRLNRFMDVHDTWIQRFVPALRERLFFGTDHVTPKLPPHSLPPYSDQDMDELTKPIVDTR